MGARIGPRAIRSATTRWWQRAWTGRWPSRTFTTRRYNCWSAAGLDIKATRIERDISLPYQVHASAEAAWQAVYQDVARYWDLYKLAEKLFDVEDLFQQWRFRHVSTVERIIGGKRSAGVSTGEPYLKGAMDHRLFPELWTLRAIL